MDAVTESDQTMIVASTQTDLITSDILWQCLFVIKKEFVNLDYRVSLNSYLYVFLQTVGFCDANQAFYSNALINGCV